MLRALLAEPAQRLGSADESNAFWDGVVKEYAAAAGLQLGGGGSGGGGVAVGGVAVSSAALKALQERQELLFRQHIKSYQQFVGDDSLALERLSQVQAEVIRVRDSELRVWVDELGETFGDGIQPVFDARKRREFDSSWNWAVQDVLRVYYEQMGDGDLASGFSSTELLYRIANRGTAQAAAVAEHCAQQALARRRTDVSNGLVQLATQIRELLDTPSVYKELSSPKAPHVSFDNGGAVQYTEAERAAEPSMEAYIDVLQQALDGTGVPSTSDLSHQQRSQVLELLKSSGIDGATVSYLTAQLDGRAEQADTPAVHMQSKDSSGRFGFDGRLTAQYIGALRTVATSGISLSGKCALVTGCGKGSIGLQVGQRLAYRVMAYIVMAYIVMGSIGLQVVQRLLAAGCKVFVTTSRFSRTAAEMYQQLYVAHAGRSSRLVLLPFNQASKADVDALVAHIYDVEKADLDFVVPFAALSENGRDVGDLDGKSELAHRLMLTNVLRLLGAVKNKKRAAGSRTRPAHCVLPLSPNHGTFGNDGLYSESKLGLEALLHRWESEGWLVTF